ncbi:MAG: MBL fold metallo-hydrolase [Lachnospiraceae bacterium]|nr:MBL fold metallo-hydrolase [Lachnospiraceae bacterium]
MRIVTLMENMQGSGNLSCEHGLSFYVETPKHKLLIDAGATAQFADNAEALGIDLGAVDLAILSHGHYDHGGGLVAFAERNTHALIYAQEGARGDFYHQKDGALRYIGLSEATKQLTQMAWLEGDRRIDDEISLFTGVTGRRCWPDGNRELVRSDSGQVVQDDFSHEQYLVLFCEGKKILISGCAHNGILNILDRYRELYGGEPDLVISGFHMQKKQGLTEQDVLEIHTTARELAGMSTRFYTGHCTGIEAFNIMKGIMDEQLHYVHCGDVIQL